MNLLKSKKCVIFQHSLPPFQCISSSIKPNSWFHWEKKYIYSRLGVQPRIHHIFHFLVIRKMNPYNRIFISPSKRKSLGKWSEMLGACSSSWNSKCRIVRFQASAAKYIRSALFCDIKQRTVAIPYGLSLYKQRTKVWPAFFFDFLTLVPKRR